MRLDPRKKRDYFIMAALRGPDTASSTVKEFTTAVIRHFVGLTFTGAILCTPDEIKAQTGRYGSFKKEWWDAPEHFRTHIKLGFSALLHSSKKKEVQEYIDFVKNELSVSLLMSLDC